MTRAPRVASATLALALLCALPSAASTQTLSPLEIIDRVDQLMRGASSHGTVTMEIHTEHWARTLSLEIWSLGTEHSLVRVESPPKEEGTATLKSGEEIWNYLPRVDRTIKVPPSLMMGSWMGSHFTNDDLVKESRLIEDYDISISHDGERDGTEVWEIELLPKPDAPVVWGRILQQVRKADLMPTWARYYDEDGELVRSMEFSDFRRLDDRLVPATMTVRPADKPEETTVVSYQDLAFDIGLEPDFFSLRNLRRGR